MKMGWLKVTYEFVLRIVQFESIGSFPGYDTPQLPLAPPEHSIPAVSTAIQPFKPSIVCKYPELQARGWELCNSKTSRGCWLRDPQADYPALTQYDIHTNYEIRTPKGVTREYWINIGTNPEVSPDGFPKTEGQYINGTYPGPLLEACWGDEIVVHVTNSGQTNGTTIHWHGIRQLGSNEMDGVNGITQCPIAPGDSFTYRFTAMQYGHTWYHSHYSLQYPDGVAAPLFIYGPTSADWDVELGPFLMTDWVHNTAYIAFESEMEGTPPQSDSIVVNGHGHFNGTLDKGSYYQTAVSPGKKHVLKLINGGVGTSFVFSIDNHNITVIANDLVAVEPFTVESLVIGIGQRYTVIIEANQPAANYWMRTVPAIGCSGFATAPDNRTGILRYNSGSTALPTTQQQPSLASSLACRDTSTTLLHPIVPWIVDRHPQNNVTDDTFHAGLQSTPDVELGPPGFPYRHWFVGSQPLWIDFAKPTILNIEASLNNPNYTVVPEDFSDGFIYLIVDASLINVTHPIHLHGSDFVILAQDTSPWNATTSPKLFNFNNPPRRDVAILPGGGFLAMAFRPDNPGAWLLHCHIAWHASSGLALQILVQPNNMTDFNGDLTDTRRVCQDWARSPLAADIVALQEDSGI
ncbi:multicopper oxidase [Xylariaceae sp. FL0255]|nr:multicopper oxidase [Xylariaceae sp. FL0255]